MNIEITSFKVDLYPNYANRPELILEVNYVDMQEFTFEEYEIKGRTATFYIGWNKYKNMARFYVCTSDQRGFGGTTVEVTMKDGSRKFLKGPWSSRCGIINQYFIQDPEDHLVDAITNGMHGYYYPVWFLEQHNITVARQPNRDASISYEVTNNGIFYKPWSL